MIAFEPDPANFAAILHSVRLNELEQRVKVFNMTLSEEDGEVDLYRDPQGLRSSLVTATSYPEVIPVRVCSLDAMVGELGLERIDLIKVDVEGEEPSTIRGMMGTLERFDRPTVWCEVRGPNGSSRAPDTLTPVREMMRTLRYRALKFDGTPQPRPLSSGDVEGSGSQDVIFVAHP